jgi:hypothetical protein
VSDPADTWLKIVALPANQAANERISTCGIGQNQSTRLKISAGQKNDEIDYWQLDVIANACWTFGAFTPYVGYTYSDVDFSGRWSKEIVYYGQVNYDASFSNQNKFTALSWVDVDSGMNFKANIQGIFVSSTAPTLGISYCF